MARPIKGIVSKGYVNRYRKGYPLLTEEALLNPEQLKEEGQLIRLYDEEDRFVATGYFGRQNKGCGWILELDEKAVIDKGFFKNRFLKAVAARKSLFGDPETTAFRLFNGEGDGIGGLIIDFYDNYYVISFYSKGIFAFRDVILEALQETVGCYGIYQKKRFDTDGKYIEENDFVLGCEAPEPLIVLENGIRYAVYLNDGAMTGIFLDQREVRKRIRDTYAHGRTVLNTFSYTGAFSVAAALGGAVQTTSVDLANRSLSKTREQFQANGIDPDTQQILVEDVFNYFKYGSRKGVQYDLVILDPPSYATSKDFTFAAERDYTRLLQQAIAMTAPEGVIVASTNCSAFGMDKFKGFVRRAFEESMVEWELLESFSLPPDFRTLPEYPEGNYLKVLFVKRLESVDGGNIIAE